MTRYGRTFPVDYRGGPGDEIDLFASCSCMPNLGGLVCYPVSISGPRLNWQLCWLEVDRKYNH